MKKPAISDKRQSCRYPCYMPVKCSRIGVREPSNRNSLVVCTTVDLSESGIGVNLNAGALQRGAVISIRMPVRDTRVNVPVLSEVRWVNEVRPGEFQAGLMFIS